LARAYKRTKISYISINKKKEDDILCLECFSSLLRDIPDPDNRARFGDAPQKNFEEDVEWHRQIRADDISIKDDYEHDAEKGGAKMSRKEKVK
jgi:hypothetical protein